MRRCCDTLIRRINKFNKSIEANAMPNDVPNFECILLFARRNENILFIIRTSLSACFRIKTVAFHFNDSDYYVDSVFIVSVGLRALSFSAALLLAQKKERFKFKQVSHESLLNYSTHITSVCRRTSRVAACSIMSAIWMLGVI